MSYCEVRVRKAKVKTWQKKKHPTFLKGVSLIQSLLLNKVTAGKTKLLTVSDAGRLRWDAINLFIH